MSRIKSAIMSPIGRRGGTTNDADAVDACATRGGCDAGRAMEPGTGVAIDTGDTGCGTPCCAEGGIDGGIEGGAYDTGPDGIADGAPACCGYGASSVIL
jgi:hypothetical protein